ncbi:hypothetical protein CHELA40_10925 [Chelatococcus asaccharovorans]|nr:hypothetical protein CHELA40_10925 [Chelatococcus asaccharovorans]CAH1685773.1 hypothetical protein CHELA17_64674 [Chelatococcus asaccharovorans]
MSSRRAAWKPGKGIEEKGTQELCIRGEWIPFPSLRDAGDDTPWFAVRLWSAPLVIKGNSVSHRCGGGEG